MNLSLRRRAGQAMTETLVMLPIYLGIILGLIQIGQLGIALIVTNYSASKIARKAVAEQTFASSGGAVSMTSFKTDLENSMVVGMSAGDVVGCVSQSNSVLRELEVRASTKVDAIPFFGDLMHIGMQATYADSPLVGCNEPAKTIGPFNFSSRSPYYWTVHGVAKARMNYAGN